MNDTWAPLDTYREMKVSANGKILVIRPSDSATVVPLFCPLCTFSLKTADDSIAFRKKQCCDKCILFCRGDKAQVPLEQWEEYLLERQNGPKPLITIR